MVINGARGELDDSANGTHAEACSSRALPPTVISNGVGRACMSDAMNKTYHHDDDGIMFNKK